MNGRVFGKRGGAVLLPFLAVSVLLVADCQKTLAAGGDAAATVTIAASPSQTIKGWGCIPSEHEGWSLASGMLGSLSERPAIQEAVYSLGFTVVRCSLQSSYGLPPNGQLNTSSSGGIGGLVTQLDIARAHGVNQYILCVWSPPESMHDTGVAQGIVSFRGVEHRSALRPDQEVAFTQYIVRAIHYLHGKGFPAPLAVTIQNEPDHAVPTDGTLYTPTGNPDTDQFCHVVKLLRAQLDTGSLQSTVVSGPDTSTYGRAQWYLGCLFGFLAEPQLNAAIGALSSHSYTASDGTVNDLTDYTTAALGTHKELWMTEWSLPDGLSEIDGAIALAQHLAGDLVSVPNNYWFWRDAWWLSAGAPTGRALIGGDDKPVFSKRYYLLKKLWTKVRPGWKVKKVTDAAAGKTVFPAQEADMIAFENESGDKSAGLLTNIHAEDQQLIVKGITGTSAAVFCTSAYQDMAELPPVPVTNGAVTLTMPGRSVTFLEVH